MRPGRGPTRAPKFADTTNTVFLGLSSYKTRPHEMYPWYVWGRPSGETMTKDLQRWKGSRAGGTESSFLFLPNVQ